MNQPLVLIALYGDDVILIAKNDDVMIVRSIFHFN